MTNAARRARRDLFTRGHYNRRHGNDGGAWELQVAAARVDLAAAFRLAVRLDLHEGVCNHFSYMLPDGKRFLL